MFVDGECFDASQLLSQLKIWIHEVAVNRQLQKEAQHVMPKLHQRASNPHVLVVKSART